MSSALRVECLWKSYAAGVRGCSARIWVLRGLSLTIGWGERVAVVGEVGAGKTTLLHCVAGLRRPDAGLVDAPGLANGALMLATVREWREGHGPRWSPSRSVLLVGDELAGVAADVDRILLLQEGQLTAIGTDAHGRRVAEPASRQCLR